MNRSEWEALYGPAPPWLRRFLAMCVRLPAEEDQQVGCLWWCGAQSKGGQRPGGTPYGSFYIERGLIVRSHIAVATATGLITDYRVPSGYHVDHACNRTLCVERRHFQLLPLEANIKKRWAERPRPLTPEAEDIIRYRGVREYEYE